MIYYFVLITLSILGFYCLFNIKSKTKYSGFLGALIFLTLGALRNEVGTDWDAYEVIFNNITNIDTIIKSNFEKLFISFIYISKQISNEYVFFTGLFFACSFLMKYLFFKKYSRNIYISYAIYLYTIFIIYDINGIRQGMAIAILLLSFESIVNRKLIKFLSIVFIASMFHFSALIFIPTYFLMKIKIKTSQYLIILISCLLTAYTIQSFILNNNYIANLLSTDSFVHYKTYFNFKGDELKSLPLFSIGFIQRIFIFILFVFYYDIIEIVDSEKRLMLNIYFGGIALFMFLSFSSELAARLSFYFKAFEMIIIPNIIMSQKQIHNRLILTTIIILLCFIGLSRILIIKDNGLTPYNSLLW